MAPRKIFGVGLARTGTTSLHTAMGILGISSAPDSIPLLADPNHRILSHYDAFFDNPIPFMYRELDQAWPGSRFIATTRPLGDWLCSMAWLFDEGLARLSPTERRIGDRVHLAVYGITDFDERILTKVWHDHHEGLRGWFGDRDDLLWLELGDGMGWGPLCDFLQIPRPETAFPHCNAATDPSRVRWLRRLFRR
jgi:hypothetical protein